MRSCVTVMLLILAFSISSCSFQKRSAESIPPPLRTLYVSSSAPYDSLTTKIKTMLRSVHIRLVKHPMDSEYLLKIDHIRFSRSSPVMTTTLFVTTIKYYLYVDVSLLKLKQQKPLFQKTLMAFSSISQDTHQVYTPDVAELLKNELERDITIQIYYLLTDVPKIQGINHLSAIAINNSHQ